MVFSPMPAPILPCAAAGVGVAPRGPEAARHRARGHAPRSAGRAGRRHRGGAAAAGGALPRRRGGDQPTHRRARGGDPRGARGPRGRDAGEPPRPALSPLDPRRACDRRRSRPLPRPRPRAALGGARAARAARRAPPRGAAPRARPREDAEGPPLAPSPALRDRGAGEPTHGGARRARAAARPPRALLRPRARRGRAPARALPRARHRGLRRVGGARPRPLPGDRLPRVPGSRLGDARPAPARRPPPWAPRLAPPPGAAGRGPAGAARRRARSRARDTAVYGEGAALGLGLSPEIAYRECRALDWETPDRHRRAVRRLGLPAWRRRQETPAEWARRITMAADFLAGFERALGRAPITRPAVRTLAPRAWRPLAPRRARRWTLQR